MVIFQDHIQQLLMSYQSGNSSKQGWEICKQQESKMPIEEMVISVLQDCIKIVKVEIIAPISNGDSPTELKR